MAMNLAKLPAEDINTMAMSYLASRVLYTITYIGITNETLSYARSGAWGWSLWLPIMGIVRAAKTMA